MRIKSRPFQNKSDDVFIKEAFSKFGECSFQYKSDEILITYSSPELAKQAYSSLNNTTLSDFCFSLELLHPQSNDIEITIPSRPINFLTPAPNELTPSGSSHSPFFPDVSQSPGDSLKSSPINNEHLRPESPISVSMIPIGISVIITEKEENKSESLPEPKPDTLPIKRLSETANISEEKLKKKAQTVFCAICEKSIKKKSVKSHNASKIHQFNLRIT